MYPEEVVREETIGDYVVKVIVDPCQPNPREWDHLGTMVFFGEYHHKNEEEFSSLESFLEWEKEEKPIILELRVSSQGDRIVGEEYIGASEPDGFIYVSREAARKEFGRNYRKRALALLECELKILSYCLAGEVYGYQVWHNGEEIDSCYGFIGESDYALLEGILSAKSAQARAQTGEVFANLCFAL